LEPERAAEFRYDNALVFSIDDATVTLPSALPAQYVTLRMTYFRMPNRLVLPEDDDGNALVATVLSKTANSITVDVVPETFTTSEPLDFIAGQPGFRWRAIDTTPTSIVGTTLNFAANAVPATVVAGDFVCLARETPVAQCPEALLPLLKQATAVTILEALKDSGAKTAADKRGDMEKRILATLSPRVQNARRVLFNKFAPGVRGSLRWWR